MEWHFSHCSLSPIGRALVRACNCKDRSDKSSEYFYKPRPPPPPGPSHLKYWTISMRAVNSAGLQEAVISCWENSLISAPNGCLCLYSVTPYLNLKIKGHSPLRLDCSTGVLIKNHSWWHFGVEDETFIRSKRHSGLIWLWLTTGLNVSNTH